LGNSMASSVKKTLVHVIDDDEAVRDSIDAYLTLKGMVVETFGSAHEFLIHAGVSPDIFILDVNMPDIDGFTLLQVLREKGELAPAIFITGLGDPSMRLRAGRAGVAAFLDKPLNSPVLLETLWRLLA
jgi:two-component system, LuxR family, response regulator FixJ